jgi:predicted lipoprotein with Yx(FWY)xxD motif
MTGWIGKHTRAVVVIAAVASLGLVACSDDDATPTEPAASAPASPTVDANAVTISSGTAKDVGTVLIDAEGLTLYLFKPEESGEIACTKKCLDFWPAIMLEDGQTAAAGDGVDAAKLGTIARPDGGTQVTYGGWPLYLFAGDKKPGQANGQGLDDVWFAIDTEGAAAS